MRVTSCWNFPKSEDFLNLTCGIAYGVGIIDGRDKSADGSEFVANNFANTSTFSLKIDIMPFAGIGTRVNLVMRLLNVCSDCDRI